MTAGVAPRCAAAMLLVHTAAAMMSHKMFMKPPCAPPAEAVCIDWAAMNFDTAAKVVVPCGECVKVGCDTPAIDALGGIDVHGKLVFPDYAAECPAGPQPRVVVTTPFLHVQGDLVMRSTRPTSGVPDVQIVLTGDTEHPLVPHAANADKCSPTCRVGKKAVAVAGGQLDIQGLPDGCTAWTKLAGVATGSMPDVPPPAPPAVAEGCSAAVVTNTFEGEAHHWNSHYSPGGWEVVPGDAGSSAYFLAKGRSATWQGPMLTLNSYITCFAADTQYYFSMRVRLTKPGSNESSLCESAGTNCLKGVLFTQNTDPAGGADKKYWHSKVYGPGTTWGPPGRVRDGEWYWIHGTFSMKDYEVDASNMVTRRLFFDGPEPGVDIAVDDVTISSVPLPQFRFQPGDAVCKNLVPFNGDAERSLGQYPYPLYADSAPQVEVVSETLPDGSDNAYFALRNRREYWHGLKAALDTRCVQEGTEYTFSMRLRLPNAAEGESVRLFRFHELNGAQKSWRSLKECGELTAADGWVTCSVDYTFDAADAAADRMLFYIETNTANSAHPDVDFDDISVAFKTGPVTHLEVEGDGIDTCWGAGSEVLVTSRSQLYDEHDTAVITSVAAAGANRWRLAVDRILPPSLMLATDAVYAPEVALLSRNLQFVGAGDANALHGGHLIIYHTMLPQRIDGLEVRRFGQQQNLGRYPLHFHMCMSSEGSAVSRNVVRESLQRCVVLHGTHNVTVADNVAFDTAGHCFMLEDGGEMDNVLERNLGAFTKPAAKIRAEETDDTPSTFWLTNPKNTFRGNVAAGSAHSGFWFEMRSSVRGPTQMMVEAGLNPSRLPLTLFEDNVAHSSHEHGVKTYPGVGYDPQEQGLASFVNTRSYRNRGAGVFFHNSQNLHVEGGLYADNRVQVDFDRSPGCSLNGATVIGASPAYRAFAEAAGTLQHCPSSWPLVGVQLHTYWAGGPYALGADVSNTAFAHLGAATGCPGSAAVEADYYEDRGYFDARSSLTGLTFDSDTAPRKVSLCRAAATGQDHIAIRVDEGVFGAAGYVLSDSPRVSGFLPQGACTRDAGACALYCPNQCLRVWGASLPSLTPDELEMVVTRVDTQQEVVVRGHYELPTVDMTEEVDMAEHTKVWRRRRFFVHLPTGGSYSVAFRLNNAPYDPLFVEADFEDEPGACSGAVTVDVVRDAKAQCTHDLIHNGDASAGVEGWWATSGGVQTVDETASGQGLALSSMYRSAKWYGLVQFLDTRCFANGAEYRFSAKVKLYDQDGAPFVCDGDSVSCPSVVLVTMEGVEGRHHGHLYRSIAQRTSSWVASEWNTYEGDFVVSEQQAAADTAYIYLDNVPAGVAMVWDDVSIAPPPPPEACSPTFLESTFDAGFEGWDGHGASYDVVAEGGNSYLQTTDRVHPWHGPRRDLDFSCLEAKTYVVTAQLRISKVDGFSDCHNSQADGAYGTRCAKMVLFTHDRNPVDGSDIKHWTVVGHAAPAADGEWFTFQDEYTFSAAQVDLTNVLARRVWIEGPEPGVDIAVDEVVIAEKVCGDVVLDASFSGSYHGFNSHWSPGGFFLSDVDSHTPGDKYFLAPARTRSWHGPMFNLPFRCMQAGATYRITAKARLTSEKADGVPSNCQADGSGCMNLFMFSQDVDGAKRWTWIGNGGQHNDGTWFSFEATRTFTLQDVDPAVVQTRRMYFQNAEPGVAIAVDDVKMERVY